MAPKFRIAPKARMRHQRRPRNPMSPNRTIWKSKVMVDAWVWCMPVINTTINFMASNVRVDSIFSANCRKIVSKKKFRESPKGYFRKEWIIQIYVYQMRIAKCWVVSLRMQTNLTEYYLCAFYVWHYSKIYIYLFNWMGWALPFVFRFRKWVKWMCNGFGVFPPPLWPLLEQIERSMMWVIYCRNK